MDELKNSNDWPQSGLDVHEVVDATEGPTVEKLGSEYD